MREINECTAEVFRRSEKRIKERKRNRNRVLAWCIPLCLLVTVWSVTILPAMLPAGMDNAAEGESIGSINDADGVENPGLVHSFVLVDVEGTGSHSQHHSTITDASTINGVFEEIYTILIPHESHNDIVGDFADGAIGIPDNDGSDELKDYNNTTKASSYVITMKTADGVERTFTLTDDRIYDTEMNIEITLTEEQLAGLRAALGLTD